jgi:hypothetical protein
VNKFQDNIISIKTKLDNIIDKVINTTELNTDLNLTLVAKTLAVRVAPSNLVAYDNYEELNLSMVNYTECENKLRQRFMLPTNYYFIVKKLDYNPEANVQDRQSKAVVSGSVMLEFYDPIKKEKLDASICNETPVKYKIPLENAAKFRMTNVKALSRSQIDIFDDTTIPFTSRCYRMIDDTYNADTTINMRRKNYYLGQMNCSNNCQYNGLINYTIIDCTCEGLQTKETFHTLLNRTLDLYSNINLDIFECWKEAYNRVKLFFNKFIF